MPQTLTRIIALAAAALSFGGCNRLLDRPHDVPVSAAGGGTVSISMTGKLTLSDRIDGATLEQLKSLEDDSVDLERRFAYVESAKGKSHLSLDFGRPVDFVWSGPETSDKWLSVSVTPDGTVAGSIGLHVSYAGDSGWRFEGDGPPVDLTQPGALEADVVFTKNGTEAVGNGRVRVEWKLDPNVTHEWIHHHVPRGAM